MIPASPQQILLPVATWLIVASVLAALTANLVPWPLDAAAFRPDFCALMLLYWGIHQPRRVAFSAAFALGIAIDLVDASLLGQHALAYVALLFSAIVLNRRILNFGFPGQSLHVLALLFATELIMIAVRLLAGDGLPATRYLWGPFLGAALWTPLSILLRLPRLRATPDLV
jgi:rod shape-determining protein MreD